MLIGIMWHYAQVAKHKCYNFPKLGHLFKSLARPSWLYCYLIILKYSNSAASGTANNSFSKYHKALNKDFQHIMRKLRNQKVYASYEVLQALQKSFGTDDVSQIVKYPKLLQCKTNDLLDTISFLHKNELDAKHLTKAPWLLWQTKDDLKLKCELLLKLDLFDNMLDGLGFLLFPAELINEYSKIFASESPDFSPYRNRLYYICGKLNLPVDYFVIKVVVAWIILHLNKVKIDEVIKILQEYRISSESIVSDPWIFYHSSEKTRERLEIISSINPTPPKLWVCRCKDEFFKRFCETYDPVEPQGGDENVESLLNGMALQLQVEPKLLAALLKNVSESYEMTATLIMSRNLNILQAFGFSPPQIRRSLNILTQTTKRLQRRMGALKEIEMEPQGIPPSVFTMAEKRFEAYYTSHKMEYDVKLQLKYNKGHLGIR